MMAYPLGQTTTVKPVVSLVNKERPLITIEFAPKIYKDETEYQYEHPQFVFGERVTIIKTYPELEYTVCALELIESKTPSGRLLERPYWKYKVTNGQESYWKDESALIRYKDISSTCSSCLHFDNFHESNGRGWCQLFDRQARKHHEITNDCIVSFLTEESIDEADLPHSEYEVGSIVKLARSLAPYVGAGSLVKVIDKDEDYTEWAVFEVIECRFNQYIHDRDNPEAYLTHVDWYYRLASNDDGCALGKSLWVREDEICHFDLAHNVCTDDMRSGIL